MLTLSYPKKYTQNVRTPVRIPGCAFSLPMKVEEESLDDHNLQNQLVQRVRELRLEIILQASRDKPSASSRLIMARECAKSSPIGLLE
jgi:hypothetical protein